MPADRRPPSAAFLRAAREALDASTPRLPSFPLPAAPIPPAVAPSPPRPPAPVAPPPTPPSAPATVSPRLPGTARPPRPLGPRQLTAARQLLAGMTVTEVATRMGLHPYTVTRWKRDPRFQAELRRQVSVAIARQSEPTAGATRRNKNQPFRTRLRKKYPMPFDVHRCRPAVQAPRQTPPAFPERIASTLPSPGARQKPTRRNRNPQLRHRRRRTNPNRVRRRPATPTIGSVLYSRVCLGPGTRAATPDFSANKATEEEPADARHDHDREDPRQARGESVR
jgi:hypothetical protein